MHNFLFGHIKHFTSWTKDALYMCVYGETFRELNFRGLRPIRKIATIMRLENLALYGIYLLVWSLGMRPYPVFYLIRTRYLCLVGLAALPCRPFCFRHQLPPLSQPGLAFRVGGASCGRGLSLSALTVATLKLFVKVFFIVLENQGSVLIIQGI